MRGIPVHVELTVQVYSIIIAEFLFILILYSSINTRVRARFVSSVFTTKKLSPVGGTSTSSAGTWRTNLATSDYLTSPLARVASV